MLNRMPIDKPSRDPLAIETTAAQRELWMTAQLGDEANRACNESLAFRLRGLLDKGALRSALEDVVDRHEVFHRYVSADGRELRKMSGDRSKAGLVSELDLPTTSAEREWRNACERECARAFALDTGPLARILLINIADTDHLLVLTCHQVIGGRSLLARLVSGILTLYSARTGTPGAQDTERSAAECGTKADPQAQESSLAWWTQQLSASAPFLELPLDQPRPPQKSFAAARRELLLGTELLAQANALAAAANASLESVFVAAFAAFAQRLTGNSEILVGIPVAETGATLPLKVNTSGDLSFSQLLARVADDLRQSGEHRHLALGELLQALNYPRDYSRPALISNVVSVDTADSQVDRAGLTVEEVPVARSYAVAEMDWRLRRIGDKAQLECTFNRDLWREQTVDFRLAELATLLASAVTYPDRTLNQLAIIPAAEQRFLDQRCKGPSMRPKARHLTELLELARYTDRAAVACSGESIDYRELDRRSNQLANHLLSVGVKPNDLVGVFVERSVNMLVSLLATWKAGAAYVALDPGYPPERLLYMAQTAGLSAMITAADLDRKLSAYGCPRVYLDGEAERIAHRSEEAPEIVGRPEDTAYVIFTSGSTGKPKGVQITHGGVINFLLAMAERPGLKADDRFLAVTTLSFDIAVMELCLPLLVGGRVIIATREEALDGYRLLELIERHAINVMQATPTTWRWMLAAGWKGQQDFKALCGGEPFPLDLARQLIGYVGQVWNMYGPTETTVWSTCHQLGEKDLSGGLVPVGAPVYNTQCYVLDEQQRQVPVGVPGELFIGGSGVANGYLRMPERTAERFVPNPFGGADRLYRTGDQARLRWDGSFECLGRLDSQIKLRGYRIELGEIEAALARHPEVEECAAAVVSYSESDKRLAIYARLSERSDLNSTQMRRHLRGFLPDYMVPQLFIQVNALPLTPNGKVDRKNLPVPDPSKLPDAAQAVATARTATEREFVFIWSELLKKEQRGVNQLFFDVGGHSLLAMDMIALIEQRCGVRIHVLDILVSTIEQLAAKIDAALAERPNSEPDEGEHWQKPERPPASEIRRASRPGLLAWLLRREPG
ncbi:amino acid adenylation domain-containing protein [Proteobacteria bacterium 005FR1]|nr:amino acid adenylation domain-containing protein [Proteobacteria bacterium 005FR1]